jgi:hypothetical protein
MKPGDNKTGFDSMLRRGLSSDSTPAAQGCPDTDVLAAYYERSLAPAELEQFDAHLATCARCRAQIAALVRSELPDEKPLDAPASWLWNWRWLAPAVAAIAIIVIWVGVREHNKAENEPIEIAMTETTRQQEPDLPSAPIAQRASPARTVTGGAPSEPAAAPKSEKKLSGSSLQSLAKERGQAPRAAAGTANPGESPSSARESIGESSAGSATGVAGGVVTAPAPKEDSTAAPALVQSAPADSLSTENENVTKIAKPRASSAGAATAQRQFSLSTKRPASASPAKANTAAADQLAVRELSGQPIVIASPDPTKSWRIAVSGAIEVSNDSGVTWQMQRPGIAGAMTSGFAFSSKICWIVGRAGAVLRTVNGANWKQVAAPTTLDLTHVTVWSAKRAQVSAGDGSSYVTKDGGKSWAKQNNP